MEWTMTNIAALLAALASAGGMVVGFIKVILKINGTLIELKASTDQLNQTMCDFKDWQNKSNLKLENHEKRIYRLEHEHEHDFHNTE